MEIDMSDDDVPNPAKAKSYSGGRGKKERPTPEAKTEKPEAEMTAEERKKKAQEEAEKKRRQAILDAMKDYGFPLEDIEASNFIESYFNAQSTTIAGLGGRPTKYDPALCEWAIYLGTRGYSLSQIAFTFGVSRETLYDWGRNNPEFSDALARAREAAQNWWELIGQAALFSDRFQFGIWNKVVSTRFRKDYTDRKGLPYDPNEPETLMGPGEMLELDPRDLTEEQKKVLRIAIAKATKQES